MTTLQEACEKALEALRNASALDHSFSSQKQHYEAIESPRTALAQQGEPVAWIVEFENGERELHWNDTKESLGETQTPLYTAPQPAQPVSQPLPQEQIQSLLDDFLDSSDERLIEFARDIERAHGIREVK